MGTRLISRHVDNGEKILSYSRKGKCVIFPYKLNKLSDGVQVGFSGITLGGMDRGAFVAKMLVATVY